MMSYFEELFFSLCFFNCICKFQQITFVWTVTENSYKKSEKAFSSKIQKEKVAQAYGPRPPTTKLWKESTEKVEVIAVQSDDGRTKFDIMHSADTAKQR